ncbi:MAG: phosphohistidine phosphatase SixA [Deltaproteobacteria bacterium]|nr:phosphohistidine phosphatase SixA [Deltaproteobacteria bacterium]
MKVLLMQHGKPVPEEENPERPLSGEGRREVNSVAGFLRKAGISIGLALHSGKTRARETAELVTSELNPALKPIEEKGLSPLDDVKEIAGKLGSMNEDVLICGHLPHLGKLASFLITGEESIPIVRFRQGGVLCLESGDGKEWMIAWMVVPEILG